MTAGGAGRDRPAESSTSSFAGFPAEAFEFYEQLAADPTKSWWEAHKAIYLRAVREPLAGLGAALADEFGPPKIFRPYRDVRFSKDKTPYKDHQGMYVEACGGDAAEASGLGWYVQVSAGGLMVAGGWYQSSPDQVARYRAALATAAPAERLAGLVQALTDEGLTLGGDRLKSRPRGVPADHPNVEWLRFRTMYVERRWEPAAWMGTPDASDQVRRQWRAMRPLMDWLAEVVGPGDPAHAGKTGGQDGL